MGLDMYLHEKKYFANSELLSQEYGHYRTQTEQVKDILRVTGMNCLPENGLYVTTTVAYWRKANAIHRWFVENVQDGVDDCGEYYVSDEQINDLLDLARQTLRVARVVKGTDGSRLISNTEEVGALLPPQEGFFFGPTDFGEWYIRDLESTVEQLTEALEKQSEFSDFAYQSSW